MLRLECKVFEGIVARKVGLSFKVPDTVDPDSEKTFSIREAFQNVVADPVSRPSLVPDADAIHGSSTHATSDETLGGRVLTE